jgi:sugar lactone lactonase YvrE
LIVLFSFSATIPTLRWNSTGITVAGTGGLGTTANQFSSPMGLALDSSNTLYVSDLNNSRVQEWPANSWTGTTVAGQSSGAHGSTSDYLFQAGGLVIDSSGSVYVADIHNHRIQYWINGQATGTTVAGNGRK